MKKNAREVFKEINVQSKTDKNREKTKQKERRNEEGNKTPLFPIYSI